MDLNTIAFQVLPHSAHAGEHVSLLFNIENVTDNLIEDIGVKFYLSRNSWISTGDYELDSLEIDSIGGKSESGVRSLSLGLPGNDDDFWLDDEDATYFIGALINGVDDLGSSAAYRQFITHDAIDVTDLFIPDLKGDHFAIGSFDFQSDGNILADIGFSIFNGGDGHAGDFKVDFYITRDTDIRQNPITTDDVFLGSYDVSGLESGHSTGILSVPLNIPNAFEEFWDGSGYYSLGMRINDSGQTNESRRFSNNSNQREGIDYSINTIFHDAWVDLHGIDFNVRQENIADYQPGRNLTIDYAVRNGGLGYISQDFNLNFYVSTDTNINADDTFIGSQRFTGDLAAGAHGKGVADFILPDNLPAPTDGRYYVGFVIDADQEVFENNEANNGSTGELLDYDGTGGSLDARHDSVPDLTNSYFNLVSGDYVPGGTVTVEFSAANISNIGASPFNVGIYLSNNEYISTHDLQIGTYDVNGLGAYGDTGIIQHTVTLPDASDPFWKYKGNGTYFIGTKVDPGNSHEEFTELNNANLGYKIDSDAHSITGLNFTDLVGASFSATPADGDHRLKPGEEVNISYQIANQDGLSAGAFEVKFYLSSNDYISENDVLVGTHQINGLDGLTATDILNGTFELPDASNEIWSHFDGAYYLGMIIDGAQQVVEISHQNNQNLGQHLDSDTVEVVGTNIDGDNADLIGSSLTIVDGVSENNTVEAGAEIEVQYSVLNAGGNYAPFFANEFFLVERSALDSIQNLSVGDVDYHSVFGLFGDQDSALIKLEPYDFTDNQDVTVKIPQNISPGHYALVMQTDVFEEVSESNEFNNIIHTDIFSIEGPDLYNEHLSLTEDFTKEDPLLPGETFTADYEIVNGGTEDIPFFAAHFYLLTKEYFEENSGFFGTVEFEDIDYNPNINSPDFDPDSDPLFTDVFPLYGDEFTEVLTLGAGHSTGLQTIELEIPEDYNLVPGKYYLAIQSDVFDEVHEPNEINNSLFSPTNDFVELYIGGEEIVM